MKNNLNFYPVFTSELKEKSGLVTGNYSFSFNKNGIYYDLKAKGKNIVKLSDPEEFWKVDDDGVCFDRDVIIEYPSFLYGPEGLACKGSELGVCILWKNAQLSLAGCILPDNEDVPDGMQIDVHFHHDFKPGEVDGAIELTLCLYLKRIAPQVHPDETHLINEAGVILGEIDDKVIDINSIYREFPIVEVNAADEPLWWVSFSNWEDPASSMCEFTTENVCVYLNVYYKACPMTDGKVRNLDMLIEILASVYTMIFERLKKYDGYYDRTIMDNNLADNSICKVMHKFYEECEYPLSPESPESMHKSIQKNLRYIFTNGEEEE